MNVNPQKENYEKYLLLYQIDCKIIEILIKNQNHYIIFIVLINKLGRFVKFYEPLLNLLISKVYYKTVLYIIMYVSKNSPNIKMLI